MTMMMMMPVLMTEIIKTVHSQKISCHVGQHYAIKHRTRQLFAFCNTRISTVQCYFSSANKCQFQFKFSLVQLFQIQFGTVISSLSFISVQKYAKITVLFLILVYIQFQFQYSFSFCYNTVTHSPTNSSDSLSKFYIQLMLYSS